MHFFCLSHVNIFMFVFCHDFCSLLNVPHLTVSPSALSLDVVPSVLGFLAIKNCFYQLKCFYFDPTRFLQSSSPTVAKFRTGNKKSGLFFKPDKQDTLKKNTTKITDDKQESLEKKPDYVHQAGPKKTVKMDLSREARTI